MSSVPAFTSEEINRHLQDVPGWEVVVEDNEPRLKRVFQFKDFSHALTFTNQVGQAAEQQNHHPALLTEWGKVTVYWWTHRVRGLLLEDFVAARNTNELYEKAK
jgi:4a-hydroxytetrahydrobiopterin dehydratase